MDIVSVSTQGNRSCFPSFLNGHSELCDLLRVHGHFQSKEEFSDGLSNKRATAFGTGRLPDCIEEDSNVNIREC
jgi:hypothetical protein